MPALPDCPRPNRSILKLSMGVTLAVVVTLLAIFIVGAPPVEAATCTWSALGPPADWTVIANWTGCGTTYPGANPGDTANLSTSQTINVTTAIPNAVALNFFGSPVLQVNSGGALPLASASLTSGGTITVNTGGQITNTGAMTFGFGSFLNVAGGTLTNNAGGAIAIGSGATLTLSAGTLTNNASMTVTSPGLFTWSGGTLTGPGTTVLSGPFYPGAATLNITNSAGPTILSGQVLRDLGLINYSATINSFSIDSGAQINGGGDIQLTGDAPINSNLSGNPLISSPSGTFIKTAGSGTSMINVPVDTSGTPGTAVAITSSALGIAFNQGGKHNNATLFQCTVPGCTFTFGGNHTFGAGVSTSGSPNLVIASGGALEIDANLTLATATLKNFGTLKFGSSPAFTYTLSVPAYTQTGTLVVKLNGTAAGTNYDQLNVTGLATLGGNVTATLGYVPADLQLWDIITSLSESGVFATRTLPSYLRGIIRDLPPTATKTQLQAVPQADAGIAKTGPSTVLDGMNATYTVTVTNYGPAPASTVTVTDTFSGGTFVSATPAGTCTGTASPITCTMTVATGLPQTITVVLKGTPAGNLNNAAVISAATPADPNPANNSASFTTAVSAAADLAISSITAAPNPVNAAQSETFTITGSNIGPDAASPAQLNLTLTSGTFTSLSSGAFTCVVATGICTAATLPTGPWTVTAVAQAPPQAGTMTLNATIGSTIADPNPANNTGSSVPVTVTALADLQITKTLITPLDAGANASYTISVKNLGPSDASGITVSDTTPAGLLFVSNSGACTTVYPCNIATLIAGATATITTTYSVPSNASGTVTNTASVTAATPDPLIANNSGSATNAITQKADLAVTKTGPANAQPNSNVTFTITVTNNGPADASNVQLADPAPAGLSFVSATGACTSFPCSIGTMTAGSSKTTQAIYMVLPGPATTIVNTATATATTPDPNSANNAGSASLLTGCPQTAPGNPVPPAGATNAPTAGVLSWSNAGAAAYTVYLDVAGPTACTKFYGGTSSNTLPYSGLLPGTTYQWRVEATSPGCPTLTTPCMTFTTTATCPTNAPVLISPLGGTVTGPVTFSWSPVIGAADYQLFVDGTLLATTTSTTYGPAPAGSGVISWYVVAEFAPPCTPLQSQTGTFSACDTSAAPLPSIVGQATSGQGYDLTWTAVAGATLYEVTESTDPNFNGGATLSTANTKMHFQHTVTTSTAFYYRLRAFLPCANGYGANSLPVRVVLVPVSPSANPNAAVPAGNTGLVSIVVHVPGFPDGTFPFTATLDRPWLIRVDPSSGALPPGGIDLTVFADPATLPNGTFTGTVIVSVTLSKGSLAANGFTTVSAPVSVSLVTPVTPKPGGTPPANALIIPSVGHLDGINSHWQSDIRLANTSSQTAQYQLTFTPDDINKGVKQTIIQVSPGTTTALDDIIKTWYGVGALGENANGVLEIRQAGTSGKGLPDSPDAVNVSLTTVASSRTYNVASNGTLGQFIPAVLFSNFVGKAPPNQAATILGLQQIAQSDAYRTNLGLVEAAGKPVSVLVSVFDNAGTKLLDLPIELKASQQRQLNGFLAQNKISLTDGRAEVKVVSGEGRITAYASVVDNKSTDPLVVSGVPLGQLQSDHYVLPGVADISTGQASWRTDMRVFNPTSTPQFVTLTFYPQNGGGSPLTSSLSVEAGKTVAIDSALVTLFGGAGKNTGGAIHLTTGTLSSLVVTARTYNLTANGTFGQFVPAVTAADGVGKGDRALQILQAEESVRYRTNLGIAEVTGKPVTVEVSAFLPDSKVTPSATIPLSANEFYQQPQILKSLGLTNVYNVRISVRVVAGDGKISAYGSVIDQKTQDPTYVPAQ